MRSRLLAIPLVRPLALRLRRWLRYARYAGQYRAFASRSRDTRVDMPVRWRERRVTLGGATGASAFDRHYVYHTGWAARILAELRPERHVDIASLLYFDVVASAFVPIDLYEYRPAAIALDGLRSDHADLTALPFEDGSIPSLSCMHVVEHVGLGRYGDELDPTGDLTAMRELRRVLAPGGSLLFVVPVGTPRVEFNAHRVYAYEQVAGAFSDLELVEFALVPDDPADGDLLRAADPGLVARQSYGCGCFWFRAPRTTRVPAASYASTSTDADGVDA